MNILDERIVFDTNIWIFGLRRHKNLPACVFLLKQLYLLQIILPRQILLELKANLTGTELKVLFSLLKQFPKHVVISWDKAKEETVSKYQKLGCKLGDAVVSAHLEELHINLLVSENRHFLKEIKNLPFRCLNATEALAELKK